MYDALLDQSAWIKHKEGRPSRTYYAVCIHVSLHEYISDYLLSLFVHLDFILSANSNIHQNHCAAILFQTGVFRKASPILYTEILIFTFKFKIKWLFNSEGLLAFTREESFKTWLEIFFWISLLLSYFQSAFSIPPFGFRLLLNCIKF